MSSFLEFCEGNTRNRWRWTSVSRCGQGTMAPWARQLGRREETRKRKKEEETRKRKKRGGDPKGEVEEKSSEKTRAGRLRKRRGESQSVVP
ncbi:hypothetical protein TNCV_2764381 [Trichonephila clavipes]|nr:hypothetical protein TNCV_2764381 [Trichonephila clavipes]